MKFKEECDAILKPLGYSSHAKNGYGTVIWYSSFNADGLSPGIECKIKENGEKSMRLYGGSKMKMTLRMSAGPIQFNHPDLKKFIEVFRHYERVIKNNPPF